MKIKTVLYRLATLLLAAQPLLAAEIIVVQNVDQVIPLPQALGTDGVTPQTGLTQTSWTIWAYRKMQAPLQITAALAVKASKTLTSNGTNPADGTLITISATIDGVVKTETYRFKTTISQAYDVLIGANAAATLDNFKCALEDAGCSGEGTSWGNGTAKSELVEATTNTDTTQVVVADFYGTHGNTIAVTEDSATFDWGGSTLTGGVNGTVHDQNGYHLHAILGTQVFDKLGDVRLTYVYTNVLSFYQDVRVVGQRSNDLIVRGLGSTLAEYYDYPASSVLASGSLMKNLKDRVDMAISQIFNGLLSDYQTANTIGAALQPTRSNTAQAGGATSITLDASASGTAEFYRHKRIKIIAGTGAGQTGIITAYNQTTKVATISCEGSSSGAWFTNPDSTSVFVIEPRNR